MNRTETNIVNQHTSLAIDYIKCFGIILVIYGHYEQYTFSILKPYLFHMPLFFFLGGLLFNPNKHYKEFYKNIFYKYFLYIICIYLFLGCTAKFLHHFFGTQNMNVFSEQFWLIPFMAIKTNFHNNSLFVVGWFLFSYMLVLCLAFPLLKLLVKLENILNGLSKIFILPITFVFGYIGIVTLPEIYHPSYEYNKFEINLLSQILVGSMFFYVGFIAKKYIWNILNPITGFVLFLILTFLTQTGKIHTVSIMSWSFYGNGFLLTLLSSFIGIYITFLCAEILSKYDDIHIIKIIGKNSKSIMSFHLLAFTIIDLFFDTIGLFKINEHDLTQHFGVPTALPIYLIFSLIFSLLMGYIFKKINPKIFQ